MKKLLVLALIPVAALAQQMFPQDLSLSWTHPTQYTDLTPIEPGDLRGTLLQCSRNDNTLIVNEEVPFGGPVEQSYTFVGVIPQPGTYTCIAFSITIDGVMSDASNEVVRKYTGKPLPPALRMN